MLGSGWTEAVALAAAFGIALVTTPAGVSGAVLLLPFQVSVLGTPSPAVTPTNLLYNVIATPGALYRYWLQGQAGGSLALVFIRNRARCYRRIGHPGRAAAQAAGLRPGRGRGAASAGAVAGSDQARPAGQACPPVRVIPPLALVLLAAVVGCVGRRWRQPARQVSRWSRHGEHQRQGLPTVRCYVTPGQPLRWPGACPDG